MTDPRRIDDDPMTEALIALGFISRGRAEINKSLRHWRSRRGGGVAEPPIDKWLLWIGESMGELERRYSKQHVRAAIRAARSMRWPAPKRPPGSDCERDVWALLGEVEFSFGELAARYEARARDMLPTALEEVRIALAGKRGRNGRPPAGFTRIKDVADWYLPTQREANAADTRDAHEDWLARSDRFEGNGLNKTEAARRVANEVGRSFHQVNSVLKGLRKQRSDLGVAIKAYSQETWD